MDKNELNEKAPEQAQAPQPESAQTPEQNSEAEACATAVAGADVPLAKNSDKPERKRMTDKTKKRVHNFVVVPILILAASFIRMICVHVFMLPFNFAPGGVTGIGTMIEYGTGWFSTGYTNLIINTPLIILAFIFLSKPYAIKSAIAIGLSSAGMILMKQFGFPQYGVNDPNAQPVLAAVACGALGGIGVAMMIRAGGSNGGTDILAAFIQRKFQATNITWFIMGLDGIVIFVSFFVYGNNLTPVLMSLTQQFCNAMMGDVILTGFKSAIKYEIITDEPEELSAELIQKLKHSVTKMDATGMYAHSERALLICVIRKRQVSEFNKILKKYPNTFAYVSSTSQVFGKGFSN